MSEIEIEIGLLTERGGNAFSSEEGGTALLSKIDVGTYLVAEYNPMNYPSWGVYTQKMTEAQAVDHVQTYYGGWYARKCNLPVNLSDDDAVLSNDEIREEIIERVYQHDADTDYNLDSNNLRVAIQEAVGFLDYYVTDKDLTVIEDQIIMDTLG